MANLLEVKDLWKIYPNGIVANRGVNLEILEGEVLALLGENGAGKTTLVSIIAGYQKPTRGEMILNGSPYRPHSPRDAMRMGVVLVPQHPRLVPSYTVYENVGLALHSLGRRLARRTVKRIAEEISEKYGLSVNVDARVGELSVGEKQRVEILKALALDPWLLMLDEPTTHLTPSESAAVVKLCRELASERRSIVYITHRIGEALEVADRIAVMRNGRVVSVLDAGEADPKKLLELMFGRAVGSDKVTAPLHGSSKSGRTVLEVEDLWVKGWHGGWAVKGVNMSVKEGEIVGVAGIAGNGQRELMEAIVGLRKPERGTVRIMGVDVTMKGADARLRLGMAIIPEERLGWGLVPGKSIVYNVILGARYSKIPGLNEFTLDWGRARVHAERVVRYMDVEARSLDQPVETLSGGNMQRLIVGREVFRNPKILVAMNPTSGLDVAAATRVREEIVRLALKGAGVLLFSEDLDEILEVSSKVAVMSRGRVVAVFERPFNYEDIVEAMAS